MAYATTKRSLDQKMSPEHAVRFYETDTALIHELTQYVSGAFAAGEAAVIVVTESHLTALDHALAARGHDLGAAQANGQYISMDAGRTLSVFFDGETLDERKFRDALGSVIAAAGERYPWVRVFGEMVSLLGADQKWQCALRLEQLWNELSRTHAFSLLCAYPDHYFKREPDRHAMLCAEHTHVLADSPSSS